MTRFEWPCDLRVAHGPHTITDTTRLKQMFRREGFGTPLRFDCPGVRAHPDVMIGRQR